MKDEQTFVTLRCINCEYIDCPLAKQYVAYNSKEGCTRQVSEETAARFYHYIQEVIPFWSQYTLTQVRQSYVEIINFLYNNIYSAPLGQKVNKFGKIILSS